MSEVAVEFGPGGYPGEEEFIIPTGDGRYFSQLTGLVTIDIDTVDWNTLPKFYSKIVVEWKGKHWIPMVYNIPEIGLVFMELDGDEKQVWMAAPAKKNDKGVWAADMSRARQFKKSQYLDAIAYVNGEE